MSFSKKKAIKSLQSHLDELDFIVDQQQGNIWKSALKDTLKKYIGENSALSQKLDETYFTTKKSFTVPNVIGVYYKYIFEETTKENFKNIIIKSINHIKLNGVYKSKNFLCNFNKIEIITALIGLLTLTFSTGFYFGKIERDKETIRLEEKNSKLEIENISLKNKNDSLINISHNLNKKLVEDNK